MSKAQIKVENYQKNALLALNVDDCQSVSLKLLCVAGRVVSKCRAQINAAFPCLIAATKCRAQIQSAELRLKVQSSYTKCRAQINAAFPCLIAAAK